MSRTFALICGVACVSAAATTAPVSSHAQAARSAGVETIYPSGPDAARGIGAVRLDEKLTTVARALGPGTLVHAGTQEGFGPAEQFKEALYRYRSGTITIEVDYGEGATEPGVANSVSSISTSSPSAVLFGHRLSAGLATFEPLLKARRWRVFRCSHEVFTTLLPGGPGTGISWKHGRLHEVVIDGGGSWGQQCEH
jgi:hypothetical protein